MVHIYTNLKDCDCSCVDSKDNNIFQAGTMC